MYYFYTVKPKQQNDMKKCIFILTAVFGLFLFQSCDDDLLDIKQSFEFEISFPVMAEESEFGASELFDLADDVSIINQYGDKIKEVTIEKVLFWLEEDSNIIEGQMLTGGVLRVSDQSGENWTEIISFGEYLLQDLVGEPTNLDYNQAGVDKLGELAAEPPHSFMLDFSASFNEAPLDLKITFKFEAKMVASPLN